MKVVINTCFGGFNISEAALAAYNTAAGTTIKYAWDIQRNDKHLVAIVEQMGAKANGMCAELKVVEIPDDVEWDIAEYDESEYVEGVHRIWF